MAEPLSDRISAPSSVKRPAERPDLSWRPATTDDIDAMHQCSRAMDPIDHPHYVTTREEIAEDFEASYVDVARDSLLAIDGQGQVAAWGMTLLSPGRESFVRSILVGGVRPDARGRGIGRELFVWQQDRALQQLASSDQTVPGWMLTFINEASVDAARLYERFGFHLARYFLELRRDLAEPIEEVPPIRELRILPFTDEWSERTRLARNNAFRDHWGSQPVTGEQWESFIGRSVFRPQLSFIAVGNGLDGGEEVAGLVASSVTEEDWEPQGFSSTYIDLVGVRREWRKRGIANALLNRTLLAAATAGLERAVLDVDSDSPTGALGLYQGVGFTEASRSVSYLREF